MKTKHYVLIGIAVAFSLLPAIAPSLLSVAIIGALIGLVERFDEKIPNTRAPYHVTILVKIDASKRVAELAA